MMADKLNSLCEVVVDENRAVIVSRHNGMVYLVSAYAGWVNFCKKQVGKNAYQENPSPVSVCIGERETAIRVLQGVLTRLRVDPDC